MSKQENWKKHWDWNEFKTALDRVQNGDSHSAIAHDLGRNIKAVETILSIWRAVKQGTYSKFYSKTLVEYCKRYINNGFHPANSVTSRPHLTDAKHLDPFQWLEELMRELKLAIVDAVDYGAKQKIAEKEKELQELRQFKETAQKTNIAGMLGERFNVTLVDPPTVKEA